MGGLAGSLRHPGSLPNAHYLDLAVFSPLCDRVYVQKKKDENSDRANKDVLQIQLNPRPRILEAKQ